jgi:hypothetical protein
MRSLDWLLVVVALGAIATGVFLNGPMCYPVSGGVEYSGPPIDCIPRFPREAVIGLGVALVAVLAALLRLSLRRRGA